MGTFFKSNFGSTDIAAPKVGVIYALDTFTRADAATLGTTEIGGLTWTSINTATAAISANKATVTKSGSAGGMVIDDTRTSYTVSIKLVTTAALSGLMVRGNVSTGTGYVLYTNGAAYEFKPKTGQDAYGTAFALTSPPASAVGDVLSITVTGNQMIAKINGVTIATVTDATYTGTAKGLFVRNATGQFDDFRYEPSA